ncbi:MAG: aspartate--tRNA ligase [Clostridia bacterium]|nr:aspartate--tRNA ligase [Clostridia bacterium]MBR3714527.1 aspartate--tRNA ligase [Clostridia bacterium]
MAEFFTKDDKRTVYCGELRTSDIGKEVTVCGWIQRRRDLGSLIFIDLRDKSGIVQLAFDDATDKEVFEKAFTCRSEYVLSAKGSVRARSSVNKNIPTGEIEIFVTSMKVLSEADTLPFEIGENYNAGEEIALKYRYLDLRRPALQKNIFMRNEITRIARQYFYSNNFTEIETPMMIKATPEGARDYLVPSRIHKGCVYALPQSPQIYKQLLMIAGYDRYIQIARCFRDEDLRADRQPEFTQIDFEMSFATQEDVMNINEGLMAKLFDEILGVKLELPLPRMTYAEAMSRYGSDKPDTRFGMEIQDISNIVAASGFGVFEGAVNNGGSVRAIVVKGGASTLSRKEIDKLTEHAKGIGAKGLAYIRFVDETPNCSFAKFISPETLNAIMESIDCRRGDVALIVADANRVVLPVLGALRLKIAKQLSMIPDKFNFVWITEFPFFEWNEETQHWDAMHHPFTMPMEECLPLLESDPGAVRAKAYDLVLNGVELLSGSIRITDWKLQEKMFDALGLTKEEIAAKFGFLVDAYKYGAPPHGGSGMGLDRLTMVMSGAESLRDVVAFPKVQNASEPMSQCPAPADEQAYRDLGIAIVKE